MRLLGMLAVFSVMFTLLKAEMFLEEKIGQILIPYIDGEVADETTYEFLNTHRPGGIILYNWSNTLDSPQQVKSLSFGLQEQAGELGLAPLFIAADQEGGLVARLRNGFIEFPGNAALGRANSEELTFLSAKKMGRELMGVGVNFTFAPVVDVNSNPDNPVIGIRSYGDTPELVSRLGLAASHGFSDSGIISCLKHFPGYGDVDIDSHESLPILNKTRDALTELELVPFRKILNESPAIMTAHLRIPDLDPDYCATLSKTILTNLLREELEYKGLIVTDSLTMGAILEDCGDIAEAAVLAFEAGSDLLVIGGRTLNDPNEPVHDRDLCCIRQALLDAVKHGRITEQRVQESVDRILSVKKSFQVDAPIATEVNKQAALECAHKIAEKAVRLEKGSYPAELWNEKITIVAPKLLKEAVELSGLIEVGRSCQTLYFEGLDLNQEAIQNLEKNLENSDRIIFLSYNAWRFSGQEALLHKLSATHPLMLIAARDARDSELNNEAETIVSTVSPTAIAFSIVADHLTKAAVERDISQSEVKAIGMKIWYNECRCLKEQLIYWKDGEQWPSLGIGHFIWPPRSYNGTFRDGRFHHVLVFLKERNIQLPKWLVGACYSPWESIEEFNAQKGSREMKELMELLVATVPEQAEYMVNRFWESVPNLTHGLSAEKRHHLIKQIRRIQNEPGGLFALVDYLNFKHEGTATSEEYSGVRWGLKQVLLGMTKDKSPLESMVISAKYCLTNRVKASPQERNEVRWIPGWFARLERYLSNDANTSKEHDC